MMNWFSAVTPIPTDKIYAIQRQYITDQRINKINLSIGVYRQQNGNTFTPESVTEAEELVLSTHPHREYAPIEGFADFRMCVAKYVFGHNSDIISGERHATVQCIGGTGALSVCADFLRQFVPQSCNRAVYLPQQTWHLHANIFGDCSFAIEYYRYWSDATRALDFDALIEDITNIPLRSIIVFHAIAHNPTGCDPTPQQWQRIIAAVKRRQLFAILDVAYQGFASGDIEADGYVAKMFAKEVEQFAVALTFSKNMGVYGDRIGALSIVCATSDEAISVMSRLKSIIRTNYSHPPNSGARIVTEVLSNQSTYNKWLSDVKMMTDRLNSVRNMLQQTLTELECTSSGNNSGGVAHKWHYIGRQVGWFWLTGFSDTQIDALRDEFAIYTADNGRVNLSVINRANVDHIARAMHCVSLYNVNY